MLDLLLDALTCLPLWCAVALVVAICMTFRTNNQPSHRHWRDLAIFLTFAVLTSWFWANPVNMFRHSGPFRGRILESGTGKPIPFAAIELEWHGMYPGAQSTAWALSDEHGEYSIPWQGFKNWHIGSWPSDINFIVVSVPGFANARFRQDGTVADAEYIPSNMKESASNKGWSLHLPRLKPNIAVLSRRLDNALPGIRFAMPEAPLEIFQHAFKLACTAHVTDAEPTTDIELVQIRAWAIVAGRYQPVERDTDLENRVSALAGSRPSGDRVFTPKLVLSENVAKACQELGRYQNR